MPSLKQNPDGTPHVHEYARAYLPNGKIDKMRYRCNHPDCSHSDFRANIKGKRTICSKCHFNETFMDSENMKRANPVCFKCANTKKAKELRSKHTVLQELIDLGIKEPDAHL
jgi:ribosomal protein S27AE